MRSAKNPADRPSRRAPLVSVRAPLVPLAGPCVVLHLFAGPAREGDIEYHMNRLGKANGCWVHTISLDICRDPSHDLLDDNLFGQLRQWCFSGKIFGFIAGFPCNTVSRARFRPGGPPPLRSRTNIFGLPGLEGKHLVACDRGSELFVRTLDLAYGVTKAGGRVLLENPADPGPPFPSFWKSSPFNRMRRSCGWMVVTGDQCMLGGPTRKRTSLATNIENMDAFNKLKCCHKVHVKLIGYDSCQRKFATQILSQYPSAMCEFISRRLFASWLSFGSGLSSVDFVPDPFLGQKGFTRTGRVRHPLPRPLHVWPTTSCRRVLAEPPDGGIASTISYCP